MIGDEQLMAYVDGELDTATRRVIEAALVNDPALRQRVEEHRRLRERIGAHFAPVVDEPLPDRLTALLKPAPEAAKPTAQIIDFAAASQRKRRTLPAWGSFGAMAASLVAGLVASPVLLPQQTLVASRDGGIVARGELASALDSQLASTQAAGAAIRIGVSFKNDQGEYCRSFDTRTFAGVACRDADNWRLPITSGAAVPGQGGYRQAGSGDALVMEAATRMMHGEPLDAAAEQQVRDKGWR